MRLRSGMLHDLELIRQENAFLLISRSWGYIWHLNHWEGNKQLAGIEKILWLWYLWIDSMTPPCSQEHESFMSLRAGRPHEFESSKISWVQDHELIMSLRSWELHEVKLMDASWSWAHEARACISSDFQILRLYLAFEPSGWQQATGRHRENSLAFILMDWQRDSSMFTRAWKFY